MRLLTNKIVRAVKTHRLALPWRMVKKLSAKVVYWKQLDIYSKDLGNSGGINSVGESPATFHRITDSASVRMSRLKATFPDKNFSARLGTSGWQCYVALKADRIVGFAWVVFGECHISEIDYIYPLNAGELFIYDCFVSADCRGRGIYPDMINRIMRDNAAELAEKFTAAVAYIAADAMNTASLRGIHKAGFTRINSIRYLHMGMFRHWWFRHPVPALPREAAPC